MFHPDYDVDYIKKIMYSNKMSNGEIRNLLKKNMFDYINDISIEKIREIQINFINAARRAKQAGFDMIQIHGDRLLGSFTFSIFSKRKDEYGGSKENRVKMSVKIVKKIREEFYDMPIDYKFPIRKENPNLGKGGPCLEEIGVFVRLLDEAGVDSFINF
ncbi:NADH:flavin oxidoreductases, Old Yellow Enzyme family [Maledivibacter halophilus]|uniref:NADH:flavin oxidoreductases, Old Yellow Enzyme family n=1 Tax=Maledivibacter halophilus TaxID=36842 RepID=A0A1T5KZP1_9FIRM|nr:NADH:flavin oxidoreductases, Old Yellow Enzyme family [Maledivibacter halophilus]